MTDDFEQRLRDGLDALTATAVPTAELRARVGDGIRAPSGTRRPLVALAAAALAVLALVGVSVARAEEPSAQVAAAVDDVPATTATTVPDPAPTRVPAGAAEPTPVPDVTTTTTAVPAPLAETVPVAPESPPCHNSTDPACGDFRWDPSPVNQPATVTAWVDGDARVDEPVTVHFTIEDPDGPTDADRNLVDADGPATSIGTTSITNTPCPDRFGPWAPPAGVGSASTSYSGITFHEAGTFVVTVTIQAPQGCGNVNPYLSGGTVSFTVEVLPTDNA